MSFLPGGLDVRLTGDFDTRCFRDDLRIPLLFGSDSIKFVLCHSLNPFLRRQNAAGDCGPRLSRITSSRAEIWFMVLFSQCRCFEYAARCSLSSKVVLPVMLAVEKSGKELLRWEITEFIAVAEGPSFSSVLIHCWVVVCGVVPEKQ
jgi:hypothetical protein